MVVRVLDVNTAVIGPELVVVMGRGSIVGACEGAPEKIGLT